MSKDDSLQRTVIDMGPRAEAMYAAPAAGSPFGVITQAETLVVTKWADDTQLFLAEFEAANGDPALQAAAIQRHASRIAERNPTLPGESESLAAFDAALENSLAGES